MPRKVADRWTNHPIFFNSLTFKAEYDFRTQFQTLGALTRNPREATFFWVPHLLLTLWQGGQPWYWRKRLRPFLEKIITELPFYNRSGGVDHLFLYVFDQGPFCETLQPNYFSDFQSDPFYHQVPPPAASL